MTSGGALKEPKGAVAPPTKKKKKKFIGRYQIHITFGENY